MKKLLFSLACALFAFSFAVSAQPRPAERNQTTSVKRTAPETVVAKYEGGMFGFEKKEEGSLKFDDVNERLVFFGKDNKEKFAIPYDTMVMVYTGTTKCAKRSSTRSARKRS